MENKIVLNKVKNLYLNTNPDRTKYVFFTGLVIELEDGRVFHHQSTDPVMQFEQVVTEII